MNRIIEITDLELPELAPYVKLTEAQLKSRQQPENGLFIAEGVQVCEYAVKGGYEPVSFLMERKHIEGKAKKLLLSCPDVPVYTAESGVLSSLTGFPLTRGVLCAMKRKPLPDPEAVCTRARRLAVLEGLIDPSNLGSIFRSASALGMDGILLSADCCDVLYRKSVRVSMGSVFTLPWAVCPPGAALPALLHERGFVTVALALDEKALRLDDSRLKNAEKLALFLGSEGDGLKKETVEICDYSVIIPMHHGMDSLNVATAAAVAFWELRT